MPTIRDQKNVRIETSKTLFQTKSNLNNCNWKVDIDINHGMQIDTPKVTKV